MRYSLQMAVLAFWSGCSNEYIDSPSNYETSCSQNLDCIAVSKNVCSNTCAMMSIAVGGQEEHDRLFADVGSTCPWHVPPCRAPEVYGVCNERVCSLADEFGVIVGPVAVSSER